ncbi:MAG: FAD-binding oxidoreductase [Geodermatophilaceae bacterium]|nr:FAD-binding oxidoreductase [Geodermatophilaceae bacterium]
MPPWRPNWPGQRRKLRADAARRRLGLVDPRICAGGVFYPEDGTVRASLATAEFRDQAAQTGVRFVFDARVIAIDTRADRITAARTAEETFPADDVVVACGIWGPAVVALAGQLLALTPVAHPYVHGPPRPSSVSRHLRDGVRMGPARTMSRPTPGDTHPPVGWTR